MHLNQLKPGQSARIEQVGGEGALRQHFLDMGVIPGTEITLVKLAPLGDPMEFRLRGYELTLRVTDAEKIAVAAPGKPQKRPSGRGKPRNGRKPSTRAWARRAAFIPREAGIRCRRGPS